MPRWFTILEKTLFLQGILILLALPILLAWGFTLSWVSPLGNLIYAPCLTLILLISSLIFFTELIGIPNGIIITLFDKVASWWLAALGWGKPTFVFSVPCPPLSILIMLFVGSSLLLHYRPFFISRWRVPLLYLITGILIAALKWLYTPHEHSCIIGKEQKQLILRRHKAQIIVVDPGIRSTATSLRHWTQYMVLPELRKRYGIQQIDYLLCLRPTHNTHLIAQELLAYSHNAIIILPTWHSGPTPAIQKALIALKQWATKQGHQIKELVAGESVTDLVTAQATPIIRSPRAQQISLILTQEEVPHALEQPQDR